MRAIYKNKKLFLLVIFVITGLLSAISVVSSQADENLSDKEIIKRFNKIFYYSYAWRKDNPKWLGVPSLQNPCDNWVIQEIICEVKPDFIVETGTFMGGTALFYATVLEKVNKNGKIITVDIKPQVEEAAKVDIFRERVEVIKGDSVSPEVINAIAKKVKGHKTLVVLDSCHEKEHVLKELKMYSNFVSLNSYIVVQDTHIDGRPTLPGFGPGPMEAVEEFLKTTKDFKIDYDREKFLLTFCPSGFLKRIK